MRNKIILLIISFVMFLTASAESYETLWKHYDKAVQKDMPQDAIEVLHKIESKAEAEKSWPQLMAAMILEHNRWAEISNDSIAPARKRLRERFQTGVPATILRIVMDERIDLDSLMSLTDASEYTKANGEKQCGLLVERGSDSRYFNHDLLSLIIMRQHYEDRDSLLMHYYGDNNEMVDYLTLQSRIYNTDSVAEKIALIDSALHRWPKWDVVQELVNYRRALTCPSLRYSIDSGYEYAATERWMHFMSVRGISKVTVSITPLDAFKRAKGEPKVFTQSFKTLKDWETQKDSINIGVLEPGIYAVKVSPSVIPLWTKKTEETYDTLNVSHLQVMGVPLPEGQVRCIVTDAVSGHPVPGSMLHIRSGRYDSKVRTYLTDEKGECVVSFHNRGYGSSMAYASTHTDSIAEWKYIGGTFHRENHKDTRFAAAIYTDRALYRPGQTVEAAIVKYRISPDNVTTVLEGDTVEVILRDGHYRELTKKKAVTDSYGTAHLSFPLPEDAEGGNYLLTYLSSVAFSVEEYKRPTFDVTFQDVKTIDTKGDTVRVKGTVKSYSGAVMTGATVCVSAARRAWWWRIYQPDSNADILRDTLITDADGTFTVAIPVKKGIKEPVSWHYTLEVSATVTSLSGESQRGFVSIPMNEGNEPPKEETERRNPHCWHTLSSESFPEEDGEVNLTIGTDLKGVYAPYIVVAGETVIDQGVMRLDADSVTKTFVYKPEWGDGITVTYSWIKQGRHYGDQIRIKRTLPDKRLNIAWSTFRDKAVPGQKERWSLQITDPQGRGHKAQLMAVLYDKSLDAVRSHKWQLFDRRILTVPYVTWFYTDVAKRQYGFVTYELQTVKSRAASFSAINPKYTLFRGHRLYKTRMMSAKATSSAPMMEATAIGAFDVRGNDEDGVVLRASQADVVRVNAVVRSSVDDEMASDVAGMTAIPMRSNFGETAFFMPQLESDEKGKVELSFTLPESVTTWRFLAMAHDKDMRYGFMEDECVAQKKIMIQPQMPRFLRIGDKAVVKADITNLSDKPMKAKARLQVVDSKTQKVIGNIYNNVRVEANSTAVASFPLPKAKTTGEWTFRVTVEADGNTDGEQHVLSILPLEQQLPEVADYVINPDSMMLAALPELLLPECENAICLSNAVYANIMTAKLKDTIPDLKQNNLINRLMELQNADGSFSWYKGMHGNSYMTMAVLKTLARGQYHSGQNPLLSGIMKSAFSYMRSKMQENMEQQKKSKMSPYLSNAALDWLYTLAITNTDGGEAAKYYRKLIPEDCNKADMETKAVAAIVLNENGKRAKAKEYAEAIKQHTVYREDMGRYFDSYRTHYSWCDYRIPSQSMAIEALQSITPDDNCTIKEMQRWLFSSKRTQRWDNPYNTVNAVNAFMAKTEECPSETEQMKKATTVHAADYKQIIGVKREILWDGKPTSLLTVRITIDADRDYDFVTVTDNRPACLEPVQQLSGYHDGAYRQHRDNATIYAFDQLSKGKHTIETQYYVSKEGEFTSGNITAICTYAPEFQGSANTYTISCPGKKE
ncbi:MAG: hypothetical protein IKN75_03510 [Prevotella sp.]|nr:hypothetical protein [Prevotella sp.]